MNLYDKLHAFMTKVLEISIKLESKTAELAEQTSKFRVEENIKGEQETELLRTQLQEQEKALSLKNK